MSARVTQWWCAGGAHRAEAAVVVHVHGAGSTRGVARVVVGVVGLRARHRARRALGLGYGLARALIPRRPARLRRPQQHRRRGHAPRPPLGPIPHQKK